MDETDSADKDVEDRLTTSAIQVREARAALEEMTKRLPVRHRIQVKAARVSWVRRVLNWFKRS